MLFYNTLSYSGGKYKMSNRVFSHSYSSFYIIIQSVTVIKCFLNCIIQHSNILKGAVFSFKQTFIIYWINNIYKHFRNFPLSSLSLSPGFTRSLIDSVQRMRILKWKYLQMFRFEGEGAEEAKSKIRWKQHVWDLRILQNNNPKRFSHQSQQILEQ